MRFLSLCVLLHLLLLLPLTQATLGLDVSVGVTSSQFECLQDAGYSFVIVRCWRSSGIPDSACPNTVAAAHAAGLSVDVYMFPDYAAGNPAGQVQQAINFLQSNNVQYGIFWIDVEQPPNWGSCSQNEAFLQTIVSTADSLGQHVGIYTSNAMWGPMLCGSQNFTMYPLWYPHYDGNPSFSDFKSFGGWSSPVMKQYKGDATVCGIGADLNYAGGSATTAAAAATTTHGSSSTNNVTAASSSGHHHAASSTGKATHSTSANVHSTASHSSAVAHASTASSKSPSSSTSKTTGKRIVKQASVAVASTGGYQSSGYVDSSSYSASSSVSSSSISSSGWSYSSSAYASSSASSSSSSSYASSSGGANDAVATHTGRSTTGRSVSTSANRPRYHKRR